MKGNIRERLYELETPPPAGIWDRIAQTLDEDEHRQAPVVPISRARNTQWPKIALAASLVGFAIMTGLWFSERGKKAGKIIVKEVPVLQPDTSRNPAANSNNNNNNNLAATEPTQKQNEADSIRIVYVPQVKEVPVYISRNNEPGKQTPVRDNNNQPLQTTPINNTPVLADNKNLPKAVARDSSGKAIQDIATVRSSSGEGTVAGPLTRADKAIAQILSRISVKGDNEELDSIISESPYWKGKIQEWRNKLIHSGYTPNAVNMMDIPALLKVIENEPVRQ